MIAKADGAQGPQKGGEITSHDHRSRRCPMLGHLLEFSYCRTTGSNVLCRKILDCWWETFDVKSFLKAHFGDDQIAGISAPPQDKVLSLMEMIRKAQEGEDTDS